MGGLIDEGAKGVGVIDAAVIESLGEDEAESGDLVGLLEGVFYMALVEHVSLRGLDDEEYAKGKFGSGFRLTVCSMGVCKSLGYGCDAGVFRE